MKKAWAVHLAEQQQKQQQGSDAEEEEEAQDPETRAVDAAEVRTCPPAVMFCLSLWQACWPVSHTVFGLVHAFCCKTRLLFH